MLHTFNTQLTQLLLKSNATQWWMNVNRNIKNIIWYYHCLKHSLWITIVQTTYAQNISFKGTKFLQTRLVDMNSGRSGGGGTL